MDINVGGAVVNPVKAPTASNFLQPSRLLAQCKVHTDSGRYSLVAEHAGAVMRLPGIKS